MPHAAISSALAQAGIRLLNSLIDCAQDRGDETDDPVYVILEHWAREVQNAADLTAVFSAAQNEFSAFNANISRTESRWLDALGALFEYGGEAVPAFATNLWRAYFFRLEDASDYLWGHYPELQRVISMRTDRILPRSWGDWIIPMQTFMGIAESQLVAEAPEFERLITSQDALDMVESLAMPEPAPRAADGASFIPGPHFDATATLLAYLSACADEIGIADPRGLPGVSTISIPLMDVFTPLRLIPRSASHPDHNYARYQIANLPEQPPDNLADVPGSIPTISPQEALYRYPQILILGDSGTGKTTLLRSLVLEHTRALLDERQTSLQIENRPDGSLRMVLDRPLPVHVDLAGFVDERQPDETLESYIFRSVAEMVGDQGAAQMLARFIEAGQCVVFFDGVDRAATDDQHRMLVDSVSGLVSRWRRMGNRIVVASRPVSAGALSLLEPVEAFVIRPLDRSQIGPFLLRWSLAMIRLRRPLMRDDEALHQAQADTLGLVREVTANSHLAALAGVPLVLRLLVGLYRPGLVIAPQRVAIYQLVADALIRDWRLPQTAARSVEILEHEAHELLAYLAFWLHASRPAGALNASDLRKILINIWTLLHADAAPDQAERSIDDFVARLSAGSGVLVEIRPGRYGFIYEALQEYFAARYLVSSYRLAPARIRAYLHDPRWDEVIRLAIGFTALRSHEDASDLIENGVMGRSSGPSPFESWLKRDLFFAARLLSSGIEARQPVTQEIIKELVGLWVNGDRDSPGRFHLIFDSARRHLAGLDGTQAGRRALQNMLENLASGDERRRAFAADGATFWPAYLAEAHEALIKTGRDAPLLVRRAVAQALGRAGHLSGEGYRLLLSLVNDTDEAVSAAAREALQAANPVPQEALGLFVDMLRGEKEAARRVSLRQLQQIGALPPGVVNELIHLFSDPDAGIRHGAMEALAAAASLPENALLTICRMAMDTSSGLRLGAINALARPVELPQDVIDHLVDWTYDPEASVRRASALALGVCLNKTPTVIEALMERLNDPVDSVRVDIVETLTLKGRDDPRVRHILAHAISDPTHRVRCAVAAALRHFPRPDVEIRQALRMLLADREVIVREAALETVARLEEPGQELIDEVIALVTVQDFGIGAKAVRALASLRGLPKQALQTLVRSLPSHWETDGPAITACLRAHRPLGMEIINHIMDIAVARSVGQTQVSRIPAGLRALGLEILGNCLEEAQDIFSVLLEGAADSDAAEVQIAALRGLAHNRVLWPEVKLALLKLLKQGPLPVRCAAGVALGQLIHALPDPPLNAEEMLALAGMLADLLKEMTPRAAWESDTQTQNDLLLALSRVAARARPSPPRLASKTSAAA